MATKKSGTVDVPEEALEGRMVYIRLPLRHVELILSKGLLCSLVEGEKESNTVNTYGVRGEDFNQIANLLHYTQEQVSFETITERVLRCKVNYLVHTTRTHYTTLGETIPKWFASAFETIFGDVAATLEQNIWFISAHGAHIAPSVEQCPHFIVSTYQGDSHTGVRSLFGTTLPGGVRDAYLPRKEFLIDQNECAVEDGDGQVFATLTDSRLFIYNDLPHTTGYDYSFILSSIVETLLPLMGSTEDRTAKLQERFIATLRSYLRTVPEKKLLSLKEDLKMAEQTLNIQEERLVKARKGYEAKLFEYSTFLDADKELFDVNKAIEEVIDLVDKSKEFTNFYGSGEWLKVDTTDIFITHPNTDKEYYMGQYTICINPIRCTVHLNLAKKPPRRYDSSAVHPHADSSRDICWGNVGEPIYELIRRGSFVKAIHLIANYLRHVNGHQSMMADEWYTKEECEDKFNLTFE